MYRCVCDLFIWSEGENNNREGTGVYIILWSWEGELITLEGEFYGGKINGEYYFLDGRRIH